MGFAEDLAAAKAAPAETVDVPLQLNGTKYLFRVRKMEPREYAAETLRHAPDLTVPLDRQYGYNLSGLTAAVLPRCAVRVDGDAEVQMSADEWAELLGAVDGGAVQQFQNAVFTLNEYADAKEVAAAKKLLAAFTGN